MAAKSPARGCKRRSDVATTQIVCRFDDDTFAEIQARATAQGTSFNEQVRQLVEWGLESAREEAGHG